MRFLIDECLHTSLAVVAHSLGYAADHVNFLGLQSVTDWDLIKRILADEYVFVTNDRLDFLRLYARQKLHPGLVILIPSAIPTEQAQLFHAALEYVRNRNLTNTVLEVNRKASTVQIKEYTWPSRGGS